MWYMGGPVKKPQVVPLSPTVSAYKAITGLIPSSTIAITPGTGANVAIRTVSSGAYQAFMEVGSDGHVIGSKDQYLAFFTAVTNVTNLEVCEIFVGATSSQIARVRGLWLIPTQTAVTGAQIQWNVNKITTVGTTAAATITPRPTDSTFTTLATGISCRRGSAGGASVSFVWFQTFSFNEETNAGSLMLPYFNLMPQQLGDRVFEIVLRQGEGLNVVQTNANAVGLTGALMYFVVE